MKFIKSNIAKKLIIILIALMIFNIAVPREVKAWDLGGILLKPLTSVILSTLVSIDVGIGIILNGFTGALSALGSVIALITENEGEALNDSSKALKLIFVGPDSIFSGQVRLLNANIFEVTTSEDILSAEERKNLGAAIGASYEKEGEYLQPRKRYGYSTKRSNSKYICCVKKYLWIYYVSRTYFYGNKNSSKFS